jgi:alginate O-acetyltransferase complex protein AlgJ
VHYRLISGPLSALIQHDALVGKDGWLFWGNEEALVDIRGDRPPLSTAMLDNWMLSLELKKAWLNRRGIPFLLVIAPDKPSIYPEQLPDGIRAPIPTTGLDLLNRYLADKGVDWVLDLKPILLRRKQSAGGRLLYYPADSHWNYLGAYYAFEAILEKLRSMGVRTPPARIRENELIPSMDDRPAEFLANAPLTLVPRVPGFRLASPAPDCIEASTIPAASLPVPSPDAFATNCRLGRGKVVVIGDSFVERLRPFLSSTFARVAFVPVGDQLMDSRPLIEAEHPDLVIYEVVERRLRLDSELWAWVVKP